MPGKLQFEHEKCRVLGACFEVHREKGRGLLEAACRECLEIEFGLQGTPARSQVPLSLADKGRPLRREYVADFLCFDSIQLEIQAGSALADEHRAQVLNYLPAAGLRVNFGHHPRAEHERFVV